MPKIKPVTLPLPHIMFLEEDAAQKVGEENILYIMEEIKTLAFKSKEVHGIVSIDKENTDNIDDSIVLGWFMNTFQIKPILLSGNSHKDDLAKIMIQATLTILKNGLNLILEESKENLEKFNGGKLYVEYGKAKNHRKYSVSYDLISSNAEKVVEDLEALIRNSQLYDDSVPENSTFH